MVPLSMFKCVKYYYILFNINFIISVTICFVLYNVDLFSID